MKNLLNTAFLFFSLATFSFKAYSQSNEPDSLKIDSLKERLLTEKEDTNKVNTLNALGTALWHQNDTINMLQYERQALILAQKLNFKKGIGSAYVNISHAYYRQQNFTEAFKNIHLALQAYQQAGDKSNIAYCFYYIGYIYNRGFQKNNPEARKNYFIAIKQYESLNDNKSIAACYMGICGTYTLDENYSEAIKYNYTALKYYEMTDDKEGLGDAYQELSAIYFEQDNNEEALKNLLLALKIRQELKEDWSIGQTLNSIGSIYTNQGRYDEALKNEFEALKIFKEPNMPSWGVPFALSAIAEVYEKQADEAKNKEAADENYKNAIENYSRALTGYKKSAQKNPYFKGAVARCYISLANINLKLNNSPAAKFNLQMGFELAKSVNRKDYIRDGYLSFSKLDSAEGNYNAAYKNYKNYILYKDSLVNEETARKTLQAQMQYDNNKREAVAKANQAKKDAEDKRAKTQQYLIITALALIVLAITIIALIQFHNSKQKQKANKVLETTLSNLKATQSQLIQSEKMASLGELTAGIAHEIQNPLNFVNNFSEVNKEMLEELKAERLKPNAERDETLQDELINDVTDNSEKINHHGKRAGNIVKGMLQHSRTSTGVKEPTDTNALCDEYLRLSYHGQRAKDKSFNAEIITDFDETIGKINIIPQDIGRVLLNLFNNAFYAVNEQKKRNLNLYKPTVSVTTKKSENSVLITVSDNGNGIPKNIVDKIFQPFFTTKPTGSGTGLGLSLSYDIVKAHGGEIEVASKEDGGAGFIIQLPAEVSDTMH